MSGRVVVENNTGHTLHVYGCGTLFQVKLGNDNVRADVAWTTCLQGFAVPIGESNYPVTVNASYGACSPGRPQDGLRACQPNGSPPALPPGDYRALLFQGPTIAPSPPPITVHLTAQRSSASGSGIVGDGPTIDWSKPIPGGITTTLAAARATGSLAFTPARPHFAVATPNATPALASVQVSDPAAAPAGLRTVALVYQFPIGADFPSDGRLVIQEHEDSRMTVQDLQAVAQSQPTVASMIMIGNAQPALLFSDGVGGRVIFLRNGVSYDITGPDVTKSAVEKIATAVFAVAG